MTWSVLTVFGCSPGCMRTHQNQQQRFRTSWKHFGKRENLCPCFSTFSRIVSEADHRPVDVKLCCVSAHIVQSVPKRSVHQSDAVCKQGGIPTVWCHLSRHTAAASSDQTINQLQMNHNNIKNKTKPGNFWQMVTFLSNFWKCVKTKLQLIVWQGNVKFQSGRQMSNRLLIDLRNINFFGKIKTFFIWIVLPPNSGRLHLENSFHSFTHSVIWSDATKQIESYSIE